MTNYYYLGTLLPTLFFDVAPEISFFDLTTALKDNLSVSDYEKTKVLRQFFDILNLRSFWMGEELDPFGEMSYRDLEEALVNFFGFPDYVYDFLQTYRTKEERIQYFPLLLAQFFQEAKKIKDRFLHDYLQFERGLRLIMTALRAKKLGRDLSIEFQYEDLEEPLIAQLLTLKDSDTDDELPEAYRDLHLLFSQFSQSPKELQEAVERYRFEKIDHLVNLSDVFSSDRIFAYLAQFMIVRRGIGLDKVKGMQMVETLAKGMSS